MEASSDIISELQKKILQNYPAMWEQNYLQSNHGPVYKNVSEALGHVPFVRLNRTHYHCQRHDIFMKLECANPGGSLKEKNAAYMISKAEEMGLLKPGGTIIESSSGNLGIGLAMIGNSRGYQVKIVIDAKTSESIKLLLQAYGAELIEIDQKYCDANGSMQIARMQKAQQLAEEIPNAWYVCQHLNPMTPYAHYYTTAPEIHRAFPGGVDAIVVGVSTGGQIAGISKYFREHFPQTKLIGVDVKGSAIFKTPRHSYKMTGLGLSFTPPAFQESLVDEAYVVADELAFSYCHIMARQEGLLLGSSTGALLAAGLAYLSKAGSPKKIVIVAPDSGGRYLDTIYNQAWLKKENISLMDEHLCAQDIAELTPVIINH
ncbi:MAG: cysteine synthase family protein [Bacteriovoracaceae bacterium]|nr:cysteine synthase family protein [Bacteriovoracaceae bacterium]